MKIVEDRLIIDSRNFGFDNQDVCSTTAKSRGFPYLLFNGCIIEVESQKEIFFPPAGFWKKESLPFVGWKEGYEYKGTNEWFLCNETVGCPMLPDLDFPSNSSQNQNIKKIKF